MTESKMFIHAVEDSLYFEHIPLTHTQLSTDEEVIFSMQQTKVDPDVKSLSIHQRKCIFSDELKLKYYRDEPYTYSGCMKDCRLHQALKVCGCLPPFHRPPKINATKCDIQSLKCLKDERILDTKKCQHCELGCDFTVFTTENIQTR